MSNDWRLLTRGWQVLGILAVAIAGAGTATALSYSAKPISAQVIDAETNEPLADVIVLSAWTLEDIGGGWGGVLRVEETVSDQRGSFAFAGWGPQTVPSSPDGRLWRLDTAQPVLYAFKPGYRLKVAANHLDTWPLGKPSWTGDPVRASEWNGKQIKMERFNGSRQRMSRRCPLSAGGCPCRHADGRRFLASLLP